MRRQRRWFVSSFIQTSEEHAMKVMIRHVGPPLGYYQTIVGDLNEVTHIWGFDNMGDMEARRAPRIHTDPGWRAYLDASDGIYDRQETQNTSSPEVVSGRVITQSNSQRGRRRNTDRNLDATLICR